MLTLKFLNLNYSQFVTIQAKTNKPQRHKDHRDY